MSPFVIKLLEILAAAGSVFALIQGLKNIIPSIFDKIPNLGRWLAAAGGFCAGLIPCFGGTGMIDIMCIVTAVLTFLGAVGIYHSVVQASGTDVTPKALMARRRAQG